MKLHYFKSVFVHMAGFIAIISSLILWGVVNYPEFPKTILLSLLFVSLCYWALYILLPNPKSEVITQQPYSIFNLILSCYGANVILIALFRLDYSRPILLYGALLTYAWYLGFHLLKRRIEPIELHAIGNFDIQEFKKYENLYLHRIKTPFPLTSISNGLVVNLHHKLNKEEEKFIADCSIKNIPIYHSETIKEKLDKKIATTHLNENTITTPNLHLFYSKAKPVIEAGLILLATPVLTPFIAIICVAIYLEKSGSILFKQERTGYNGQLFVIYKFRTMKERNINTATFASDESDRISKLGFWLRKFRLDELPQLFNVLKGEMALIGPRPEQPDFVQLFESEIPFYNYRHTIKPGITGWAQVKQGYTDNTNSTKDKLGYDLYYIKNMSLDLDFEIIFRTVFIMLTGKGAK